MGNEVRTVIAGFDASPESKDGSRLAATITSMADASLIVAVALEYDPVPVIPVEPYEAARESEFAEIFRDAAQPPGREALRAKGALRAASARAPGMRRT